jgi:phosphate transport system substrate-binding protein
VGCSTAPTWPDGHGIAQARTDGVAGYVVRTNGAIGYVEYGYALVAKMQFARLRNRSGQVNEVTAASIAAAVPTRFPVETKSDDPTSGMVLTMSLTDAAAPDAYPKSALSYLILRSGHRPERQREIIRFLIWCLSDEGQAIAARRHCVPFPPALTEAMSSRLSALATPAP